MKKNNSYGVPEITVITLLLFILACLTLIFFVWVLRSVENYVQSGRTIPSDIHNALSPLFEIHNAIEFQIFVSVILISILGIKLAQIRYRHVEFGKIKEGISCKYCTNGYNQGLGYNEVGCYECGASGFGGYENHASASCKSCNGSGKMKRGKFSLTTCKCVNMYWKQKEEKMEKSYPAFKEHPSF